MRCSVAEAKSMIHLQGIGAKVITAFMFTFIGIVCLIVAYCSLRACCSRRRNHRVRQARRIYNNTTINVIAAYVSQPDRMPLIGPSRTRSSEVGEPSGALTPPLPTMTVISAYLDNPDDMYPVRSSWHQRDIVYSPVGSTASLASEDVSPPDNSGETGQPWDLPIFAYPLAAHEEEEEEEEEKLNCAICLAELQRGEVCRLLPNCLHSFHVECIDLWLRSHSTCPLCRTNVDPKGLYLPV